MKKKTRYEKFSCELKNESECEEELEEEGTTLEDVEEEYFEDEEK
ncbi:MAG: hypothetical protein QXG18_01825 [Candidatus Pacearchaeota archaeon]